MEIRQRLDGMDRKVDDIHDEVYGHEANPGLRGRVSRVETMLEGMAAGFREQEKRFDEMAIVLVGDGSKSGLKGEIDALQKQVDTSNKYNMAILVALLGVMGALVLNFLSGCTVIKPPTLTPIPTAPTVTPIKAGEPTLTPTATVTPTPTLSPTAGPPVNLLDNPGFEGEYRDAAGGRMAESWEPFYCAPPYTAERCLAPFEWKPYEPYLFIPEYNRSEQAERVQSGESAQHLFSPNKLTDSGVTQDVYGLVVGEYYWLSFYGQMWLADGTHKVILPDGAELWLDQPCVRRDSTNACVEWGSDWYHSDRATEDDFNSGWMVAGVGSCTSSAFDEEGVVWGRTYGYFDGLYDHYGEVSMGFQAWDECARVYLRFWNKYAKGHSDAYIDSAMLVRATFDMPAPEPTPTQIGPLETPMPGATPTPTAAPTPTPPPEVGCNTFPCTYGARLTYRVISAGLNVRSGPALRYPVLASYAQGAMVDVRCIRELSLSETWGSTLPCEPEPGRWFAIRIGATEYMRDTGAAEGR